MWLINADKFILALMDASLSSVDEDTILDLVDSVPTVDAVVVVRCKDCAHYDMGVCLKIYSDGNVHPEAWQERKPDDFCSYGAYAAHNMNVRETGNAVYLHYNSIRYRFRLIQRETGLNPRNFYDLEKLLAMIDTQGS